MLKSAIFSIWSVLFAFGLQAQHLKIIDPNTGKDLTNDTVNLNFVDNGFRGWQSLNIELTIQNTGNKALVTGAEKIEFDLIKNASHSFCFAQNCYDEKTFISPNKDTILPGKSDKSFSAHFIFNDTIHKPTINHVAYLFYDAVNHTDSAIIYVHYNTNKISGIQSEISTENTPVIYPNPAKDYADISGLNDNFSLSIFKLDGKEIHHQSNDKHISLSGIPTGIYLIKIKTEDRVFSYKLAVLQ